MAYQRRTKPRVEYQGPKEAHILKSAKDGWVNVSAPYYQDITPHMVQDIKTYIDSSSRAWNPTTKFWEIKESALPTMITILKKYYGDAITQNLTTSTSTSKNLFVPIFEAMKALPNGQLDKTYHLLARACHPDAGGTDALMGLLTEAYQEVKQ